jgi:hypothetical protein
MIKNDGLKSLSRIIGICIVGKAGTMFIIAGSKLSAMRFIVRAKMPNEAGNKMMQNPDGMKELESYLQTIKSEAVFL